MGGAPKSYVCSKGHATDTPADYRELTKCPAYVHGRRCDGTMRRVGAGSRAQRVGGVR